MTQTENLTLELEMKDMTRQAIKRGTKQQNLWLMGEDSKEVTGHREKAELLNSFFVSDFTQKEKK